MTPGSDPPPATPATPAASADAPRSDDPFAVRLRGFGPAGIAAILLILLTGNVAVAPLVYVPVGALLVLAWVGLSRTPWSAIGYARPRSWITTVVAGILLGVALKLAMKAIVMPLLGAPAINPTYHFLAGNRALLPAAICGMLNAGFSEETVFRGFLFERLGKLLGSSRAAKIAIVLVTSLGFGAVHYGDQGAPGVQQATIVGLVYGTIVAATGRIWLVMIAHAVFDLTALALIYWNLEEKVAHLLFR